MHQNAYLKTEKERVWWMQISHFCWTKSKNWSKRASKCIVVAYQILRDYMYFAFYLGYFNTQNTPPVTALIVIC